MSSWTHVTLTTEVSFVGCTSPEELKAQVSAKIGNSEITGSERDADIYIIPLPATFITFENGRSHFHFTDALVVVHGHLRDMTKDETEAEVKDFIDRLKSEFGCLRDLDYKVWSDVDEPSWCELDEKGGKGASKK